MDVALVTYGLSIGGMETFLLSLARALRERGANPVFVVTDHLGEWHGRPAREGFRVMEGIPRWWESRHGHARRLARTLGRFDVVILNHCRPAQAALGMLPEATVALSVLHDHVPEIYDLGLANAEALDAVVAVSRGVGEGALHRGMRAAKVRAITHGIALPQGRPDRKRMEQRPLALAFVGRLESQKGVRYLPPILSGLREKGVAFALDVVGTGLEAEALKENLAGLEADVTLHGALPHDQAMEMLSRADVLLFPSEHEGLGLVLLEAMARGVVPVASSLSGVTDTIVDDGVNGILLPVGDTDAFAAAVASLADAQLREKLSEAARSKAAAEFSLQTMAERYLALFDDCRKARSRGAGPSRSGRIDEALLGKRCRIPLLFHNAGWQVKSLLGRKGN